MKVPLDTVLESKRCRLHCVSEADTDYYWEVLQYPGFTAGLLVNPAKSKKEVVQWIKNDLAAWAKSEKFYFSVLSKSKEFLGRINIRSVHSQGIWNMGFWILPAHWGKGYAAEAAKTVLNSHLSSCKLSKCVLLMHRQIFRVKECLGK